MAVSQAIFIELHLAFKYFCCQGFWILLAFKVLTLKKEWSCISIICCLYYDRSTPEDNNTLPGLNSTKALLISDPAAYESL